MFFQSSENILPSESRKYECDQGMFIFHEEKTKTELKFFINALLIDTLKQKLIVKREASERCQTLFTIKQTPLSGRVIRTPRGCIQIQNVVPNIHSKQIIFK